MTAETSLWDQADQQGVLPDDHLKQMVREDVVYTDHRLPELNYQPASIDLRLGNTAYSLQCSFLPHGTSVSQNLAQLAISEIDIRDGAVLERNRPYLVPLLESLRLPPSIKAKTNPKSTTGRLDIFTRTVADYSQSFENITPGYHGNLYLEIFSRSFTIKVKTGLPLNQIRLVKGSSALQQGELLEFHRQTPVIYPERHTPTQDNSLALSLNLPTNDNTPAGYRARRNSALLDLSRLASYNPRDFWEPVYATQDLPFILEPEEFYLLTSEERVSLPPPYAAEMAAYDTSTGELRTHYAGFFDPGFGYQNSDSNPGVSPVLEIRAHDVPFMVSPGQTVCTLTFEKMLQPPRNCYGSHIGSSYNRSNTILSKHFS